MQVLQNVGVIMFINLVWSYQMQLLILVVLSKYVEIFGNFWILLQAESESYRASYLMNAPEGLGHLIRIGKVSLG